MHARVCMCVCVLRMHQHRGMRVRIFVRSLHVFARDVAVGCMWRCVMRVTMQVSVGYACACMCLCVVTCVCSAYMHVGYTCMHAAQEWTKACATLCAGSSCLQSCACVCV